MKISRKTRPVETSFADLIDPDGRIPHDPDRYKALCDALIVANGGQTCGPVADVLELFVYEGAFDDYLREHAAMWAERME